MSLLLVLLVVHASIDVPWTTVHRKGRCETVDHDAFLRQPLNALSNVAFVYVAVKIFACTRPLRAASVTYAYVAMLLFLAFGSFFHHACECSFGDTVDVRAAVVLLFSPLANVVYLHFGHLWALATIALGTTFAVFWDDIFVDVLNESHDNMYIAAGIVVAVTCAAYAAVLYHRPVTQYDVALAAGTLVVAMICWFPEEVLEACPVLPLHAVFHVFAAAALFFSYRLVARAETT